MEELKKEGTDTVGETEPLEAVEERKTQITIADMVKGLMEYLTAIMCAAIFLLVPLYMKNHFFGIGTAKYDIYRNILFLCIPFLVCFGALYLFFIRKQIHREWIRENLSLLDKAVLWYLLCVFLSFFLSDFKTQAVWGYDGWNMGLLSQISFVLLYFFLSRFGRWWKGLLYLLCLVSSIVFILGILNRFLIDPLGVYEGLDAKYQLQFLSTLGQSSWYSSFVCTVLPVGIFFFWSADAWWKSLLSGVYCLLGFSTLVTQNSDSAYIALVCILLTLFCFSVRSVEKMSRFYWITLFFLTATRLMNFGAHFFTNQIIEQLDSLSYFLIMSPVLWGLLGINVVLLLVHGVLEKKGLYPVKVAVTLRNIVLGLVALGLLFSILCLYLSGTGKLPEGVAKITSRIPYLTWNDMWGNRRGFSWRVTWKMFVEMSPVDKLFGVGPECYPYYAYSRYQDVLDTMFDGLVLSNAHNEWYNAVINYGVVGAVAYLGIFTTAARYFAENRKHCPIVVGIIICVISYMGHNFFCYQQVLCTPFIFCLIGFGEWFVRNKREKTN